MPRLANYQEFQGLHWETGSLRNYCAAAGFKAPHTGQAYSEALLMGVSGGAVMGYFSFAYAGYDPHVVILTRNTFDPLNTLLARLGVVQTVLQTTRAEKGVANLVDVLADGLPALVWADMFSLPYNALPDDAGMWAMMPIVVFGYDVEDDTVWIADRARVPLTTTPAILGNARGRVKEVKNRILTLDQPDPDKLPAAVAAGIWDSIKLYTEAPPKGAAYNFGLAAYRHWADLLVQPKPKLSWTRQFPRGARLYAGLTTTFDHIAIFGKDGNAERMLFADFLDEAAVVLGKPALQAVAGQFRLSGAAWDTLGAMLLPEGTPPLRETRELMLRRHHVFLAEGNTDAMQACNARLDALKAAVAADFPLGEAQVRDLCEALRSQILTIHDLEAQAVTDLKQAIL